MRIEEKVMNNGKLQAKQEKLKSLHCPSPQSSLFNSRGSSLGSQFSSLISRSPAPNLDQSTKSPTFGSQHYSKCATPSPQHNDESVANCPQQLFIDMSTELLRQGKNVRFQAPGLSMYPAIREGETIIVAPVARLNIKRGDILLYLAGTKVIAHRVVRIKREKNDSATHSSANFAIQSKSDSSANSSTRAATHSKELRSQIIFTLRGDASAICDDPVEEQQILGKVVSVERHGRKIDLYSRKARVLHIAYFRASHFKRSILCILRQWGQIFIFNKKYRGDWL
jgi:hypothetical protein